jgi:SPP1 family predicted phage head-tail adaptor
VALTNQIAAGKLDRRIVIQHRTVTQSPSGEPIETWASLPARPASLDVLNGAERYASAQLVAKAQVVFTIRWAQAVADISPVDRIIYPASAVANSPADFAGNKVYDIFAVEPVGRNEALRLLATVRQDEDL